ncbi:hypothetical protein AUP68_13920 [Ilyonectria robusta]
MTSESVLNFPFAYRALFLYFEPVRAFFSALLLHFRPASFLNAIAPAAKYTLNNQIICN